MRSYDVIVLQDVGGVGLGQPGSINRSGQSVGWLATSAFTQDAVLWSPSGKATVLQDVGGDNFSQANAVNSSGQSAGLAAMNRNATEIIRRPLQLAARKNKTPVA